MGKTPKNIQKHVIKKIVEKIVTFVYVVHKAAFWQNFTKWRRCHSIFQTEFEVNLLIHSAADFIGLSLYNKILSWEKTKHLWKQVAYFSSKEVNCKTADMKDIGHKYWGKFFIESAKFLEFWHTIAIKY